MSDGRLAARRQCADVRVCHVCEPVCESLCASLCACYFVCVCACRVSYRGKAIVPLDVPCECRFRTTTRFILFWARLPPRLRRTVISTGSPCCSLCFFTMLIASPSARSLCIESPASSCQVSAMPRVQRTRTVRDTGTGQGVCLGARSGDIHTHTHTHTHGRLIQRLSRESVQTRCE